MKSFGEVATDVLAILSGLLLSDQQHKGFARHGCAVRGQRTLRGSAKPSEARPVARSASQSAARSAVRRRRRRRPPPKAAAPKAPPPCGRSSDESWSRPNKKRRSSHRVKRGFIFSGFVGTARSCSQKAGFSLLSSPKSLRDGTPFI